MGPIAFLLSGDLRDYPPRSEGFVPFGVRGRRPRSSPGFDSLQSLVPERFVPAAARACPFGAPSAVRTETLLQHLQSTMKSVWYATKIGCRENTDRFLTDTGIWYYGLPYEDNSGYPRRTADTGQETGGGDTHIASDAHREGLAPGVVRGRREGPGSGDEATNPLGQRGRWDSPRS